MCIRDRFSPVTLLIPVIPFYTFPYNLEEGDTDLISCRYSNPSSAETSHNPCYFRSSKELHPPSNCTVFIPAKRESVTVTLNIKTGFLYMTQIRIKVLFSVYI